MDDATLFDLAARLGSVLKARGLFLATAESCTGGWIGQAVTAVSGSAAGYDRGFVTLSLSSTGTFMSSKKTVESGARAKAAEIDLMTKILWSLIFLPRHLLNAIYSLSTGWRSRAVFLPVESVCPALLELEQK